MADSLLGVRNPQSGNTSPKQNCCSLSLILKISLVFATVVLTGAALYFYFQGAPLSHVIAFGGSAGATLVLAVICIAACRKKPAQKIQPQPAAPSPQPTASTSSQPVASRPKTSIDLSLHEALKDNKKVSVKSINDLLQNPETKKLINATDEEGYTPLHLAILLGREDLVDCLVKNGADLSVTFGEEELPFLHFVILRSDSTQQDEQHCLIKKLIELGMDPNCRDATKRTALFSAVENEFDDIVTLLIQLNADVNATDEQNQTPLHVAGKKGSIGMMDCLIQLKANIAIEDENGWNPVFLCALYGYQLEDTQDHLTDVLAVEYYEKHIKDVFEHFQWSLETVNSKEWNLLHFAAHDGIETAIKALLELKIPYKAQNKEGKFPLHLAALNKQIKVIETFHDLKCSLGIPDQAGNTILHLLAEQGESEMIQKLLDKKLLIAFDQINKSGQKPIECALIKGHFETAVRMLVWHNEHFKKEYVISKKALSGSENNIQDTPLFKELFKEANGGYVLTSFEELIEVESLEGIKIYVEATQKPKISHPLLTRAHNPPSHVACLKGKVKALALLDELGAPLTGVRSQNKDGLEPIHTAINAGKSAVIDWLVKEKHVGCTLSSNSKQWVLTHYKSSSDSLYHYCLKRGHYEAWKAINTIGGKLEGEIEATEKTTVEEVLPNNSALITLLQNRGMQISRGPNDVPILRWEAQDSYCGDPFLHAAKLGNYSLLFNLIHEKKVDIHQRMVIRRDGVIKGSVYFHQLIKNPVEAVKSAVEVLSEEEIDQILDLAGMDANTMDSLDLLEGERFSPLVIGLAVKKHQNKIFQNLSRFPKQTQAAVLAAVKILWKDKFVDELLEIDITAFFPLFAALPSEEKKASRQKIQARLDEKFKSSLELFKKSYLLFKKKIEAKETFKKEDLVKIQTLITQSLSLRRMIMNWKKPENEHESKEFLGEMIFSNLETINHALSTQPGYIRLFNGYRDTISDQIKGALQKEEEEFDIFVFLNKMAYNAEGKDSMKKNDDFKELFKVEIESIPECGLAQGIDAHLIGISHTLWDFLSKENLDLLSNEKKLEALREWRNKERPKLFEIFKKINVEEDKTVVKAFIDLLDQTCNFQPDQLKDKKFEKLIFESLREADKKCKRVLLKTFVEHALKTDVSKIGISAETYSLSQWAYCRKLLKEELGLEDSLLIELLKTKSGDAKTFFQKHQVVLKLKNIDLKQIEECLKIKEDPDLAREKISAWMAKHAEDVNLYAQFYSIS